MAAAGVMASSGTASSTGCARQMVPASPTPVAAEGSQDLDARREILGLLLPLALMRTFAERSPKPRLLTRAVALLTDGLLLTFLRGADVAFPVPPAP